MAVWVPETRNAEGTQHLLVNNVVSRATQADGINLHGSVRHAKIQNTFIENTGDDSFALWGADLNPSNVTFKDCRAVNPGILRPRWYGNCVATYGLQAVVFDNVTCEAPTLADPIPQPGSRATRIDTSMFVFYTSFGGTYPKGNNITILGWNFRDLHGKPYEPAEGTMGPPGLSGKKVWTKSDSGLVAPYFLPDESQAVGVHVVPAHSH